MVVGVPDVPSPSLRDCDPDLTADELDVVDAAKPVVFFAGGRLRSQALLGEQVWCDALR